MYEERSAKDEEQMVVFELANEQYGLDVDSVYEIIRVQEITRVPKAAAFIEGVINLRSQVIPVMDLRERLGLTPAERRRSSRIVIVKVGDQTVGMIVDAVSEVVRIPSVAIEPPSTVITGVDSDCLRGIAKMEDKLIILLFLDKVVSRAERKAIAATKSP